MSTVVDVARAVATVAHRNQEDKAGNPYIDHPARVAHRLQQIGAREEAIAAGWLHDVLEDTDMTRDDLHAAGIPWTVVLTVEALTRTPDVSSEDYYEGIRGKSDALQVKLADIADNTDPNRLALLDDLTIARLTRKAAEARLLLGA